jgi:hypothetical protein
MKTTAKFFSGGFVIVLLALATANATGISGKRSEEFALTMLVFATSHLLLPWFWSFRRYWILMSSALTFHLAVIWFLFDRVWPMQHISALVFAALAFFEGSALILGCIFLQHWISQGRLSMARLKRDR